MQGLSYRSIKTSSYCPEFALIRTYHVVIGQYLTTGAITRYANEVSHTSHLDLTGRIPGNHQHRTFSQWFAGVAVWLLFLVHVYHVFYRINGLYWCILQLTRSYIVYEVICGHCIRKKCKNTDFITAAGVRCGWLSNVWSKRYILLSSKFVVNIVPCNCIPFDWAYKTMSLCTNKVVHVCEKNQKLENFNYNFNCYCDHFDNYKGPVADCAC